MALLPGHQRADSDVYRVRPLHRDRRTRADAGGTEIGDATARYYTIMRVAMGDGVLGFFTSASWIS